MRRVVLLAGPSGSGKSRLAGESGLPVLNLDDFYRDGDTPAGLPRHPDLGIVDWDDPRSWNGDAAVDTLTEICRAGAADVPVYDIAHDRATRTRRFELGTSTVFVAEGLFAADVVVACRSRGIVADALVIRRAPWANFLRRLARDLVEHRKPPLTLLRRGRALMRAEAGLVRRQVAQGARPASVDDVRATLARLARHEPGRPSGLP